MKLIVGLGNPELRYRSTRHNAGFWVLDKLATKYSAQLGQSKDLFAHLGKVSIEGQAVILAQPDTYMNLSGKSVQAIIRFYKIDAPDCLIVHDDVSLPLGRLRWQSGGGAGGQHGVENIIQMLGGKQDFHRLKFGVGPDPGGQRRADYVLSTLPVSDMPMAEKVIDLCVDSILVWLKEGVIGACNKFNGLDLRPAPAPDFPPQAVVPRKNLD